MQIDVDFEVFKNLTVRRATEDVTYNDVLRELLGLPAAKVAATDVPGSDGDWVTKGVRFAEGTLFRATYKGQVHQGVVKGGELVIEGIGYKSPSAAAMSFTTVPVNGWKIWEARTASGWVTIEKLRK